MKKSALGRAYSKIILPQRSNTHSKDFASHSLPNVHFCDRADMPNANIKEKGTATSI